ncbi:ABC transporter ATP-binding protein [Paenibacillus silvae]|uniref:ABC transporter ATP-binding protein n=1 Tax=Paenibacillus TaxID=44249 RepID=UPI001C10A627|nr:MULTISPECIES: ABC transporter ATP-binding protein [Paenibacillus]MBU5352724.1 ABC transporter ATP-binding protein/permease [Paenibacillus barcinonensis]MDM5281167.1 ABC transporter ATP-binding protein [Paenibacillus silvae]
MKVLLFYMKQFKSKLMMAVALLIVLSALSIIPALLIRNIFDLGISKNDFGYVIRLGLILALVYVVKSTLNYISNVVFAKVSQNILLNLRTDISTKLLNAPMDFFGLYSSGYLTSRLNEVNAIGGLISANTFKVILSFFELIAAFIILININVKLTLILCLLMPVYYLISNRFLLSIHRISLEAAEKNSILNEKIQQSVQGIEEVKHLSVESKETMKINKATKDLVDTSVRQSILYSVGIELIVLLGTLSSVLLIILGGRDVITSGMTLGGYMVFMNYLPKLYAPIQSISTTALTIQPAIVSLKRLHIFLDQTGEYDDDKNDVTSIEKVEFQNVSFRYNEEQHSIIDNVSFTLTTGDKLLIKGENGSGKTTIFRLLTGLYQLREKSGNILINGESIQKIDKRSLRKRIAVVSQKIYLFNDSIEKNIKYGAEHVEQSEYDRVLKVTGLDMIIESFPEKNNKSIEENGKNLSGGQIQRIAIARALLKGANILLFDEAVSHMDNQGKNSIKELIRHQLSKNICLIIDHGTEFDEVCNKKIVLRKFNSNSV